VGRDQRGCAVADALFFPFRPCLLGLHIELVPQRASTANFELTLRDYPRRLFGIPSELPSHVTSPTSPRHIIPVTTETPPTVLYLRGTFGYSYSTRFGSDIPGVGGNLRAYDVINSSHEAVCLRRSLTPPIQHQLCWIKPQLHQLRCF
jgi:hypothetical protein